MALLPFCRTFATLPCRRTTQEPQRALFEADIDRAKVIYVSIAPPRSEPMQIELPGKEQSRRDDGQPKPKAPTKTGLVALRFAANLRP
jgi:hypothetical protein